MNAFLFQFINLYNHGEIRNADNCFLFNKTAIIVQELLTPGESVLDHVGNLTERAVLARLATSLCVGVRVENW